MEHSLDIGSNKVFSKAEAKIRGKDIKMSKIMMKRLNLAKNMMKKK